jgi:hypothetical protein
VEASDLQTFARQALCDQKMAALSVAAGESPSLQNIVQLSAEMEAIYMLTSLEARGLDLIPQHHELWKRAHDFFAAAVAIWESVPVSADGELLRAHRRELERLADITKDRVEFYTFSESERRDHRHRKLD